MSEHMNGNQNNLDIYYKEEEKGIGGGKRGPGRRRGKERRRRWKEKRERGRGDP